MKITIMVVVFLMFCSPSMARVYINFDADGKWESTFDCSEQNGADYSPEEDTGCDGLRWSNPASSTGGHYSEIIPAANNSNGGGVNGFRHWINDGQNSDSGAIGVWFPNDAAVPELWVRVSIRYEQGTAWASGYPHYYKMLYFYTPLGTDSTATQAIPEYGDGKVNITPQGTSDYYQLVSPLSSGEWTTINGGATGDGQFHTYEFYMKMDTDKTDGVGRIWVDGELVAENLSMDFSDGTAGNKVGWYAMTMAINQNDPSGGPYYVDYDDIVIYSQTPPNTDANGNPWIGPVSSVPTYTYCVDNDTDTYYENGSCSSYTSNPGTGYILQSSASGIDCDDTDDTLTTDCGSEPTDSIPTKGTNLLSESFENDSWTSRSWYDGTNSTGTTIGGYSGNALKWTWAAGGTKPTGFSTIRRVLGQEVDEFLLEYYVKYDTGWQGSGVAYHPHLIHILSTEDTAYQGVANSNSNLYFESVANTSSPYTNYPSFAHQDEQRVNVSYGTPANDLTATIEDRSANQCNTPYALTGATSGTCYADNPYYSANTWRPETVAIPENDWAKITAYVKKNTFTSGEGNFDGIIKVWVNDQLAINSSTVLYAAGAYESATWNKISLAPYMQPGSGSPIAQTMWLDELSVWTVSGSSGSIAPPPILRLEN